MGRESTLVKNRVSVVTPVYNGEKHLFRLLDSLLEQTWDSVEVILSDDGSTDRTLELAETYRERFQRRGFCYRILTGRHHSASAAINRGLPWVTGEYLIWPDSDDALVPDSIRRRVAFLQANPHYQCVRSLSRYVDEEGRPADPVEKRGDLKNERLFFPILEWKTFVCCGCYMLRTEKFFKIYPQRRISEYEVGQNFQMLLPFTYFYLCPTIPEELYVVYIRPESHSHRRLTEQGEERRDAAYEQMLDEIAALCRIRDKEELRRITFWKQWRRYVLYRKYGRKRRAVFALIRLYLCRGLTLGALLWKIAGLVCGPRIRRLYRRIRGSRKGEEKGNE